MVLCDEWNQVHNQYIPTIVVHPFAMPRHRYKQLVDQFAADIHEGRLRPGTRLPTHRELAAREGLALVTATRVYAELHAMGLVSGETGRGTFVKEVLPRGHGIDLQPWSDDTVDLSFNNPSMPGRATCSGRPCANWPVPATLKRCSNTIPMEAERVTGRRWPAI
jgi:DNA-binding transcriptional MocR family regulator